MKPAPVSKRAIWQVVGSMLVFMVIVTLIILLHGSGPQADITDLDLGDRTPEQEFVSCERTLPEDDEFDEANEAVQGPIGRVSATEVLQCPRRFDGRLVTYVGEAVGDVLRRDGGAWVQVNDDAYGINTGPLPAHREFSGTNTGLAIWLPDDMVDVVATPGRRGLRGDVVRITGVLLRADPEDGGGLTIRALDVDLVSAAVAVDQPVHRPQAITALLLTCLALFLSWRERRSSTSN